jgi:signal peptidase I
MIAPMGGLVIVAGCAGALAFMRRRFVLVTVQGESMRPTLSDGDRLLMRRRTPGVPLNRDDIVAALTPDGSVERLYVKRVAAVPGDPVPSGTERVRPDHYFLLGDHPYSLDSRDWGCVPGSRIVAVATGRRP